MGGKRRARWGRPAPLVSASTNAMFRRCDTDSGEQEHAVGTSLAVPYPNPRRQKRPAMRAASRGAGARDFRRESPCTNSVPRPREIFVSEVHAPIRLRNRRRLSGRNVPSPCRGLNRRLARGGVDTRMRIFRAGTPCTNSAREPLRDFRFKSPCTNSAPEPPRDFRFESPCTNSVGGRPRRSRCETPCINSAARVAVSGRATLRPCAAARRKTRPPPAASPPRSACGAGHAAAPPHRAGWT